jgi:TPP-dependent pyruvate/acetoin dehydrogenase alpha subunit
MTHEEVLVPSAPWKQVSTTQADWDAADPQLLRAMLVQMQIIRSFEEIALKLAGEGPCTAGAFEHRSGGRSSWIHHRSATH